MQVPNLNGVTAIAAGAFHSLALKTDGTVWAWGYNADGQLGDGTIIERHTPVQVQNLSGVTAMDAGYGHSLALKSDGTVWAWGKNAEGQLGDGTNFDRHTPVQVPNLNGVTAIAAGSWHSLALKTDGTIWAWGYNDNRQLGDGTDFNRHTPVQGPNVSGVMAVASSGDHSLALRTDGIVQGWGDNFHGQLGDGTTINKRPYAVRVQHLRAVKVAADGDHSLAVGTLSPQLTVNKILKHPDTNRLRLFNLLIDGSTVAANRFSTGPQLVTPGNHTVSETGGTNTSLEEFGSVIGGDCAADGTVNLTTVDDSKFCTITNYDNSGGCPSLSICCEPGGGTQGCLQCSKPGQGCP